MKKLITVLTLTLFTNASLVLANPEGRLDVLILRQEENFLAAQGQYEEQLRAVRSMRAEVEIARSSNQGSAVIAVPVALLGVALLGGGIYLTRSNPNQPMPFAFGMILGISGTATLVGDAVYFYVKHSKLKKLESALAKNEAALKSKLDRLNSDLVELEALRLKRQKAN